MMPVILLAGIYGGATTPTEAAAVAALYALLVSGCSTGRSACGRCTISSSIPPRSSASVGLVIGSALIFNYIVATENIPAAISGSLVEMDLTRMEFLLLVNGLFLLLGCVLDASTIILVIIPLFLPTASALGVDPIHFGVMSVVNCMIGLITPPYGMLLFVINGVTGIAIKDMVKEGLPFLLALLIVLAALTFFPELILFLPRMFGYEG